MNNIQKTLPHFGIIKTKKFVSDIRYFVAKLDNDLSPELSGEDLRAIKDYPSIYVYVSEEEYYKNRIFYIGQSINIEQRVKQHKSKLNEDKYEKFNGFKNGKFFVFYSEDISKNLNFIEKTLIMCFTKQFNIFNFCKLSDLKDKDGSISKKLANRDSGLDSGKYQNLREDLYDDIIKPILNELVEFNILGKESIRKDENYFALFRQTPFYDLTENQRNILQEIMNNLNSDLSIVNIHGIKGEAGTGKTVLILHLIGTYINKYPGNKVAIYLRRTQRKRFEDILKAYGIDLKNDNLIIGTFNNIINSLHDDKTYDLIIVDEAQRTTKLLKKAYPTGAKTDIDILEKIEEKSQLEYFYKKANNLVIAYDIEQNLRSVDTTEFDKDFANNIDNKKVFFRNDNTKETKCFLHTLKPQLRVMHKEHSEFAIQYINFVKNALGLNNNKNFSDFIIKNLEYKYIKIANSENEWVDYIKDKQKKFPYKKSVLISGYCKPVKRDKSNNKLADFTKLKNSNENEIIYWSNNEFDFRDYSKQILTVGNVYDIQGFDIDFAGVYIGKDIYFCEKDRKTKTDIKSFFDRGTKKGLDADEIDLFIRKSYYVLLTRAVHGQIWYIEDFSLRNEIKKKLKLQ